MKRIFIGVVLAVMITATWCPFTEAGSNPTVYLDDSKLEFDVPPQIVSGRTLVPMRTIFEALGASISWNNTTKTVQGSKDSINLKMTINSNTYYINDEAKTTDVAPMILNGRTLVPLRIIAESLQCKVDYNGSTNVVTIESGSITIVSSYSDDDLFPVEVGNKYGYEDQNGNMVIKPRFDDAWYFSEGRAKIMMGEKYGYIDINGNTVISTRFDDAYSFNEGRALIIIADKYGYIDINGNMVIKPTYDYATEFLDGRAIVRVDNGKEGFIDKTGKMIIAAKYDSIMPFYKGKAQVKMGDYWYYMDTNGKIISDKLIDNFEIVDFGILDHEFDQMWDGNPHYTFTYTLTLKNTGNTTWYLDDAGYWVFFTNEDDSGSGIGVEEVKPGEYYKIEDTLYDVPGFKYISMTKDGGTACESFGTPIGYEFLVSY